MSILTKEKKKRTNEMAQWIKSFTTKPGDWSLIPRTETGEGENQLPHIVLWPLHTCCGNPAHTRTQIRE